eukprot:1336792-Pyramimonas_sp.AAC.1
MSQKLAAFFKDQRLQEVQKLRHAQGQAAAQEEESKDSTEFSARELKTKNMWDKVKSENFNVPTSTGKDNAIGARWGYALRTDAAVQAEYAQAKGWPAQREVRRQWAKKEYEAWFKTQGFKHEVKNTKTETKRGTYMTLQRIAHKSGGGAAGMRRAVKIATNATLLGGHWVKWDDMGECVLYLHIEHHLEDKWGQSWTQWS